MVVGVPFAVGFAGALLSGRAKIVLGIGVALWLAVTLFSLLTPCPDNASECYPWLGALLGLWGLAGWVAGVGLATLAQRAAERRRREL